MTLPFAEKPERSSIYSDLTPKKLSEITNANFESFLERFFASGTDGLEDEYRRLALLQYITGKQTYPAVTGLMKNVNVTDTAGTGNPTGTLFQPNEGEVWILCGLATASLNAARADALLFDGSVGVKIGQETSAALMFEPPGISPVYITNDVYLQYQFITATGNCTIRCSVMRIR
jgi:hypothetical protein